MSWTDILTSYEQKIKTCADAAQAPQRTNNEKGAKDVNQTNPTSQTPKKVPVACSAKSKQAVKSATIKRKKRGRKPANRLKTLAKRRNDWLQYLQVTGWPMSTQEVREMFGITNPKFTAERINQDGEYISITKEMHKSRKTLIFRAINYER